jgi:hypothetical protein
MGDKVVAGGRPGFWFPLVLLGFGLLGLLGLLGWDSVRAGQDFGWFAYTPLSPEPGYATQNSIMVSAYVTVGLPPGPGRLPLQDESWVVLVIVALVATVAWYGRRAGGSFLPYAAVAVGGGIAVVAGYVAAGMAGTADEPAALITSVGLPLAGLGGLACAYGRPAPLLRLVVLVFGAGCLLVGLATMLGAWSPGLFLPVAIAAGLLALARYERSRLLALVAVTALVTMALIPAGPLSLLIPAAVMLAGGVVALARPVAPA